MLRQRLTEFHMRVSSEQHLDEDLALLSCLLVQLPHGKGKSKDDRTLRIDTYKFPEFLDCILVLQILAE